MIRKLTILFCDNEHGIPGGSVFPDPDNTDLTAEAVIEKGINQVRREAKAAGWSRVQGGDYCPTCTENGI